MKKGIQLPLSFIIFLIILVIVVVLLLIWQTTGFDIANLIIGNVSCDVVNNTSGGAVSYGCR